MGTVVENDAAGESSLHASAILVSHPCIRAPPIRLCWKTHAAGRERQNRRANTVQFWIATNARFTIAANNGLFGHQPEGTQAVGSAITPLLNSTCSAVHRAVDATAPDMPWSSGTGTAMRWADQPLEEK